MRQLFGLRHMPWTTLFGALVGGLVVLSTPEIVGPLRDAYDHWRPVLTMNGDLVDRDAESVTLHIYGRKHRGEECRLIGVYGYTVSPSGRLSDAIATRVDIPAASRARDVGDYDIGLWRIKPVADDADMVRVVAQHDCVGRTILSVIAEVPL